ncbi:type II CAAX endopeptidase family protein [Hydrogenoanaerobacterium sp.]|uniref:CPBP family intramembrane glutamic endopeptidase n=1 Tax=Hydrogenoanaerobacterium sp. TaxID=2953763 RepID=UPI0028979833|nr:type II CAAX endopeptidase family protein [Hydrogenoanaerobacterium sp.]
MSKVKKFVLQFTIAVCGVFVVLFGLTMFNRYLLRTFSLPWRMVLMIVTQWLFFLAPGILMLREKESIHDLGFTKEKILKQILIGVLLALVMSVILTVLPILLGFKDFVGSTSYTQSWQFAYEFVYAIFGVALAEELVFRGYLFHKLLEIKNSRWFAITISSMLFGLFHIFSGNLMQIIMTAIIAFLYCIFREKVKDCTLLSLITAHGLYDALLVLWVAYL